MNTFRNLVRRLLSDAGNAKSLRFKSNLEKDLAGAVYLSEAPSPPRFLSWDGQVPTY